MLLISGAIMSVLEKISYREEIKFPMVSCKNVAKHFTGKHKLTEWERSAILEYKLNMHLKKIGEREHFNGILECFCQ
jgi:hypothetical protein